jgi:DNA-binding CsgD family transcriptional regulator
MRTLTPAESMLVDLVARGLSNDELASARGASRSTIANQLTRVYRKLGVTGRRELCALIGRERVPQPAPKFLSRREREVLTFADFGHSNKLIAHSLGLSVSTVSTMLTRARRKLEVSGARGRNGAHEFQRVLRSS